MQHGELVAAHARRAVQRPQAGTHARRELAQQGIAGSVAEGIVDGLEAIEIETEHSKAAGPADILEGIADATIEQRAIGQSGQCIVVGEVGELGLHVVQFGHVLMGRDPAAIVDRLVGHRNHLAGVEPVNAAQRAVFADGAQPIGHVILDVVAHMGVAGDAGLEDLAEGGAAPPQFGRQPVNVEELLVAQHQPSLPVIERNAMRQIVENGVQAQVLRVQLAPRQAQRAGELQQLGAMGLGGRRRLGIGLSGLWQCAGAPEIPRKSKLIT